MISFIHGKWELHTWKRQCDYLPCLLELRLLSVGWQALWGFMLAGTSPRRDSGDHSLPVWLQFQEASSRRSFQHQLLGPLGDFVASPERQRHFRGWVIWYKINFSEFWSIYVGCGFYTYPPTKLKRDKNMDESYEPGVNKLWLMGQSGLPLVFV